MSNCIILGDTEEIRKDAKISADIKSVSMRLLGMAYPDLHERPHNNPVDWGELPDKLCQELGIHPDNEVAILLNFYQRYIDNKK